ncbi:MAG: TolC family protein [Phycisphaerales bacterium]|nr:TolC family protein [Phycisphaerales bacterium]
MTRVLAVAALLAASGCASLTPGLGFDDVKGDVSRRTGMTVRWDSGSRADAEAAAAVDRLLGEELSADGAVQVALLSNRELQAVYEDLSIAQADLVQAGLLRNPLLSGEVRWATDGGGTGVALGVSQDFLSLLFIPLRQRVARAGFDAAKLRVTGAVLDMADRTRAAFYDAQAAAQLVELRRTVLAATGASYELAQRLRAAGNNRELDVASERAMHEQARLDLAQADAEWAAARERLTDLMGLWGGRTDWRMGPRLPDLPEAEPDHARVESAAVAASLDLGVARTEVEAAGRALGLAGPLAGAEGAEVGAVAEREVEGGWSVGPSASIPVPILDTGRARTFGARARLRQAEARYYAEAVHVRSAARAARDAVAAARERADYLRAVLIPLRRQIVDLTQLQYNGMQVGAFQLLSARRDQVEAGVRYVDALRDYWLARTRLDTLLAGRLTDPPGPRAESRAAPTSAGDHE